MKIYISVSFILLSIWAWGQELSKHQETKFLQMENALVPFVSDFSKDSLSFEARASITHDFIPRFVATLKEKNSFQYPFDSLVYISKITAPDNSFRIFTWSLKEPLGDHRYYGAIQFNAEHLELIPLFDFSDTMQYHTQEELNPKNWYGCIYYNIVLNKTKEGKKIYTLFGLDYGDFVSNKKILEIMTIEPKNQVHFGSEALLEYYDTLGVLVQKKNRLFLEYNDKAVIGLNFNKEKEMIVFDHISPPSEKEKDAEFSYVPDGTYEGFEWIKDKWIWKERVYTYSINKPDSPPMPFPQKEAKRNIFGQ